MIWRAAAVWLSVRGFAFAGGLVLGATWTYLNHHHDEGAHLHGR